MTLGVLDVADEALRRSDDLLCELIETVETARALPMSASCVLPRERLLDLLDELREVLPPEISEARSVVARREAVLSEARDTAAGLRERAVGESDALLAETAHRVEDLMADARAQAEATMAVAREEHARLVASTTVHQAAAQAAAALREDAERYQSQIAAEAQQYDNRVRTDANTYAHGARVDAERYATKLTADAENYAERTLDDLAAVLNRAAQTAEQGRSALAQRRATAWTADGPFGDPLEPGGSALADRTERDDRGERSPISA